MIFYRRATRLYARTLICMRTRKAHTPRWSSTPAVFIGDTPYELTTSTHVEAQLSVTRITCTTLREDLNKGTNAGGEYT